MDNVVWTSSVAVAPLSLMSRRGRAGEAVGAVLNGFESSIRVGLAGGMISILGSGICWKGGVTGLCCLEATGFTSGIPML